MRTPQKDPGPLLWRGAWLRTGAWLITMGLCMAATAQDAPPEAQSQDYELSVAADPNTWHVGDVGKATVVVRPHAPWSIKNVTPFTLLATVTAGLELPRGTFTSKDFVDGKGAERAVLIPLKARAPGDQGVNIAVNFFLCTDEVCQRFKGAVRLPLQVQGP